MTKKKFYLKVLKALNSILEKFDIDPIDPAEYYAEQTRKEFRKFYEEGRIDWMPEKITARIDEDGEIKIYIEPLPPFIRATVLKAVYDTKKDVFDAPLDNG